MSAIEISQLAGSAVTLIGVIFIIYKTFSDPDIKAANKIGLIEQGCQMKHSVIDDKFSAISEDIKFIKENHLMHIEADVKLLQEGQVKLFTILDERLPRIK